MDVRKKWSTGKLIVSIISFVVFVLITFQSCAIGLSDRLSNNGSNSGIVGFTCGLFMLVGAIITIVTRNSKSEAGCIVATLFYFVATIIVISADSVYPDLPVWGSVAFSFALVNLGSLIAESPKYKNKQEIVLAGVIAGSIIFFVISPTLLNYISKIRSKNLENVKKDVYTLGDTLIFDGFEIVLGNQISYSTINNSYSNYSKKIVVKIPVTIKNIQKESQVINSYYYKLFGSKGTQLNKVGNYFDDSVEEAEYLRSGAFYIKYFYLLYDGDGTYAIEFSKRNEKIIVEFEVKNSELSTAKKKSGNRFFYSSIYLIAPVGQLLIASLTASSFF